jgi:hypothetical protein
MQVARGSKMELRITKVLAWSIGLIHVFAFSGIVYKSQIYGQIPVAEGDPYGLGDIIGLLFAFSVASLWLLSIITALILSIMYFKANWLFSIKTSAYSTVGLMGYFYMVVIV